MGPHGGRVPGTFGMVREEARRGGSRSSERFQNLPVQGRPARRGNRLEDGLASELVAQDEGLALGPQEPQVDARVRVIGCLAHHPAQEPCIDAGPDHRGGFQHGPAGRRETCRALEDDVANRAWNTLGIAGCEQFRDHERIAAGLPVHEVRVEASLGDEGTDRIHRQGRERNAADVAARRQRCEDVAQGVVPMQLVVAVGGDQHRLEGRDAAPQELDGVQGGLVRPVQVLDHVDRGSGQLEILEQAGEWHGRAVGGLPKAGETASRMGGDFLKRPERRGGRQRIAAAPQDTLAPAMGRCEMFEKRRFAETRFAADQHDPTLPGPQILRALLQDLQRGLAFEKRHGLASRRPRSCRIPIRDDSPARHALFMTMPGSRSGARIEVRLIGYAGRPVDTRAAHPGPCPPVGAPGRRLSRDRSGSAPCPVERIGR
jgi:hypothetical protein